MTIKTQTLAELIFKASLFEKLPDEERELYDYYLDELKEIKSPIEQIMSALLLHCSNGYQYICIPEKEYPLTFSSFVSNQVKIGKYRADFVIENSITDKNNVLKTYDISKIVIECDGHDFHEKTKEQAKHDKRRDRFFVSKGYKVLRFTGSEIYNDWEKIIEEITEILEKDIYNWEKENKELFAKMSRGDV